MIKVGINTSGETEKVPFSSKAKQITVPDMIHIHENLKMNVQRVFCYQCATFPTNGSQVAPSQII